MRSRERLIEVMRTINENQPFRVYLKVMSEILEKRQGVDWSTGVSPEQFLDERGVHSQHLRELFCEAAWYQTEDFKRLHPQKKEAPNG